MATRTTLLRILSDATGATKDIDGLDAKLKKVGSYSAEAVVKIKTDAAQAQIKKLDDRLRHLGQQKQTPEVKIATARTLKQLERVRREFDQVGMAGVKAGEKASVGFGRVGDKLREHRKDFVGYAKAAVGVSAAYAAITDAKGAVEATDEIAKATLLLSRNFGLTVEEASKWAVVARSRDIDPTALHMGFTRLSASVEKAAHGSKTAAGAFRILGINQADVLRGQHDFPFLLDKVTKGFSGLHGGTQRAALAQQLFGRGARGLLPLLRSGALGFEAQAKQAEKYGATLKGKSLESVEKLVAAQRNAKIATTGLQIAFGTGLAPILTRVTTRITKFIGQMRDGTGAGGRFARAMRQIVNPLRSIVNFLARHPHVIAAAIAAWAAYKVAALASLAITRTRLLGMFFGLKAPAAAAGEASGRAFGAAFALFAGFELAQILKPQIDALAAYAANAITGIDPRQTAAQRAATASSEKAKAEAQAAKGQVGIWIDASGKQHNIKPKRVPTLNIDTGKAFLAKPDKGGRGGSGADGSSSIPLPGSGATQRGLKLAYDQAVKEYQHQVRLHGVNSGAAIEAASAVVSAREAMNAPGVAADKKAAADAKARHRKEEAAARKYARDHRPATKGTLDALHAADRRDRYEKIVGRYGADSPQAKAELKRDNVANARDTVKTDRGILADAVRRFGASSDKAVKAHTRLVYEQARLTKATDALKHAVTKTCNGALIPRATDVARHGGVGAPASVGGSSSSPWGWGGYRPGWQHIENVHLSMPQMTPVDASYDGVRLARSLKRSGKALPT